MYLLMVNLTPFQVDDRDTEGDGIASQGLDSSLHASAW
jgi:hypothetical protein